jgi:hypothetical protein
LAEGEAAALALGAACTDDANDRNPIIEWIPRERPSSSHSNAACGTDARPDAGMAARRPADGAGFETNEKKKLFETGQAASSGPARTRI